MKVFPLITVNTIASLSQKEELKKLKKWKNKTDVQRLHNIASVYKFFEGQICANFVASPIFCYYSFLHAKSKRYFKLL